MSAVAVGTTDSTASPSFVLVHGAWGGGHEFSAVAKILRANGYEVFTPTLTGLGERTHLLNEDTGLETHIEDVINVFRFEGIENAVLLGHSYAGMVITGVADRIPEKIAALVYLDAAIPQDGQALIDLGIFDAGYLGEIRKERDNGVLGLLFPGGSALDGVPEEELEKIVPHPTATFVEPIRLTGEYISISNKTYVSASEFPAFHHFYELVSADPNWHASQVQSGHNVHIEAPERTAGILMEAASRGEVR